MGDTNWRRDAGLDTDHAAQATSVADAGERRARAGRIRQRALELIDALGADHPLVSEALARADALDAEADAPGEIRLR